MAATLPVWSQLTYLIICVIALVCVAFATLLPKSMPSFFYRPYGYAFPSCAIALTFIVIILVLLLPTIVQLVTSPYEDALDSFCVILGRLSLWAMSISLIFSLRSITGLLKVGFERMIVLHGVLGIFGLLTGIVHGILAFFHESSLSRMFAQSGIQAVTGCGVLLLSFIFASVYRWLPHGYRLFRLTHWMVYVAVALLAYHAYLREGRFSEHYSPSAKAHSIFFITCICLSFVERLMELYSSLRQLYDTFKSVNRGKYGLKPLPWCSRIESIHPLIDGDEDMPKACQLTIRCPLKPLPGQWVSLSFPGMDIIGHPYSVLPPLPGTDNEQRFLISGKGFIAQKLLNTSPERLKGEPVLVHGPYGASELPRQICSSGEYAAFVCGGAGVVPVASIIQGLRLPIQRSGVSLLWHFYNIDFLGVILPSIGEVGHRRLLYSGNEGKISHPLLADAEDGKWADSTSGDLSPTSCYLTPELTLLDHHSTPGTDELEDFVATASARAIKAGASRINFFLCGPHALIKLALRTINCSKLPSGLSLGSIRRENFCLLPW